MAPILTAVHIAAASPPTAAEPGAFGIRPEPAAGDRAANPPGAGARADAAVAESAEA
jgi:hypothetical protein